MGCTHPRLSLHIKDVPLWLAVEILDLSFLSEGMTGVDYPWWNHTPTVVQRASKANPSGERTWNDILWR
jgi:hypothetical protein